MKTAAKAFAPGNISCIFKIHEDPDPSKMGSYGLGFTVDKGAIVEVKLSEKKEIFFNGSKINFPTVKSVVKKLTASKKIKITVNIQSSLPLGGGFGLSGASALATAYAINQLLDLKFSNLTLARIAHTAEVENRTGLGDVVNQYFGGFLLKLKPSSRFEVKKILLDNIPVYCRIFSGLSTKKIISEPKIKNTINESAENALKKINKLLLNSPKSKMKFSDLISLSKEFARNSNLLTNKKVIAEIKKIEESGGHASMIMLGNAVFSDTPFKNAVQFTISNSPARLL